jgi:hypothetical protein
VSESSIAACIVCRNEGHKLGECLDSVGWTDEVLVLDLESDDDSATVAAERGATVVRRAPHPIVEPLRDEIASHASAEWILVLDPDERVTPGLAQALRRQAQRADIDAVVVPRMNVDFGWEPVAPLHRYEPQLRMYRRSAVQWPHFPNRLPQVPEDRLARLPPRDELVLRHLRNVSVAETADRLVRYAPAQAQAMYDAGQRFSVAAMSAALRRVARRHVVEARAWEEGMPGMVRAIVLVNHHVYVWIAFWQLCGAPRSAADDRAVRRLGLLLWPLSALARVRGRVRNSLAARRAP